MKILAVIALIVYSLFSTAGNIYLGLRLMSVPQIIPTQDIMAETLAAVGNLVELPQGVVPTIATVEDPEILKKQGLFPTALKGDMILVYPEEKKAILYRPSTNKVVEISVVSLVQEPQAETSPAPAPTPEPMPAPAAPPISP
ncbi:MAG: hypothetical protein WC813_00380 [Patescibacteria group bacterium]